MRDPNRMQPLLQEVIRLWRTAPDLRFMQLMQWVVEMEDSFYLEDDVLLQKVSKKYRDQKHLSRIKGDIG